MRISGSILILAFLLGSVGSGVQAQQSDSIGFDKTFNSAFADAQEVCKALWSAQAFDSLRLKIPLGAEKPTFAMLKSPEKLKAKS
jgi:hypothetical protein